MTMNLWYKSVLYINLRKDISFYEFLVVTFRFSLMHLTNSDNERIEERHWHFFRMNVGRSSSMYHRRWMGTSHAKLTMLYQWQWKYEKRHRYFFHSYECLMIIRNIVDLTRDVLCIISRWYFDSDSSKMSKNDIDFSFAVISV